MFDFIKELSFVRIAGSKEELKAANMIIDKCQSLCYDAFLEPFNIPFSNVTVEKCVINGKEYEVTGFLRSTNINGDFSLVYVDHIDNIKNLDLDGKVALLYHRINYKAYEELAKKNVIAIIAASGSLYDNREDTDLEINILRDKHLEHGVIPCFTLRLMDIEEIVLNDYHNGHLELEQTQVEVESNNVIVSVKGRRKETIVLTAHYDSVFFSKGAYDNASGAATLLDLMSRINKDDLEYSLRFVFCGAEERGLLGSKYHTSIKENLENVILNINVDMTGVTLGYDLCCVSGNDSLLNYAKSVCLAAGFNVYVYEGAYSSDSTPFADNGVVSLTFARDAYSTGARIHSRLDNGNFMNAKSFNHSCDIIYNFLNNVLTSKYIPYDLEVSPKVKDLVDKYYFRKK